MRTALNATGLALGVLSAVLLYLGSRETPAAIESFSGESGDEKAFRRRRQRWVASGFILLALAFACQFAALFSN